MKSQTLSGLLATCRGAFLLLAASLVLATSAEPAASPRAKLEIVTKYKSSGADSAHLKMGLRNDDNSPPAKKEPPAVHPMVLPLQHRQWLNRERGGLVAFPSAPTDSYLDALEHSHASAAEHTRRRPEQLPVGPVYRPEAPASRRPANSSSASSPQTRLETKRLSHGPGLAELADQPYRSSLAGPGYGRWTPYGAEYGGEPGYESYGPVPVYGPASTGSSGGQYALASGTSQPGESKGLGSLSATYSTSYPLPDIFPLALFPPLDLTWPISIKIDTYTLIKIILKLIVFKMIVKFIAVVCLLIFIPKLIHKSHDNGYDDKSRRFDSDKGVSPIEYFDSLTPRITEAIEYYRRQNKSANKTSGRNCRGGGECRAERRARDPGDTTRGDEDARLFRSYLEEERARISEER